MTVAVLLQLPFNNMLSIFELLIKIWTGFTNGQKSGVGN